MKILVKLYNTNKYDLNSVVIKKVELEEVEKVSVETIEDNKIIDLGFDEVDPYKEYCVIIFKNKEKSYYRNSMVDLFYI